MTSRVRALRRIVPDINARAVGSNLLMVGVMVVPIVADLYLDTPCPLKAATGFDCAGCGGTRAVKALLSGDVTGAADLNLFLVAAPVLATLTLGLSRWRPAWTLWRVDRFGLAMVAAVLWTLVRNVPGLAVLQAAS